LDREARNAYTILVIKRHGKQPLRIQRGWEETIDMDLRTTGCEVDVIRFMSNGRLWY
jgi:hypothetical protein